jgi:DNA-binding XRE family transcriptional regulator
LVERSAVNRVVAGSNPASSATAKRKKVMFKTLEYGSGSQTVYVYHFPSDAKSLFFPCKIGRAKGDPWRRITNQQASMKEKPVVSLLIHTNDARRDEMLLHVLLSDHKLKTYGNEWFQTNPETVLKLYQENDSDELKIGQLIRLHRIVQGMTQVDLAKAAGLRQGTISAVESCDREIRLSTLEEILRELKLRIKFVPIEEDTEPLRLAP